MKFSILLLFLALPLPLLAQHPATIKVVGVAEERVPPDELHISCTIRSEGKELSEVAAANRARAAEITKLLRDEGLGEAELSTGSASFGERSEYKNGRHIKLGYLATTQISICTGKLKLHDKLWFALSKFPEVSVSASFALKDRSKIRETARTKALQAARRKAVQMAAALEASVGLPQSISEGIPQAGFTYSNNISRNSIDATLSDDDRGPLEPGLLSVIERVEVTFALAD